MNRKVLDQHGLPAVRRRSCVWCWCLALLLSLTEASPAFADRISVAGTILSSERAVMMALGLGTDYAAGRIVGFDLESVPFNVLGFLIVDDGIPATGPDPSGGPFTGIDVDAIAGISAISGLPVYAARIGIFQPGPEITPSSFSDAADADPHIDGLAGVVESTLGGPDAVIPRSPTWTIQGFTSIGSGGVLGLNFAEPVNPRSNIGGTIYDLLLFDVAGAGDNGFFLVSRQPLGTPAVNPVPEPASIYQFLVAASCLAAYCWYRRRQVLA